MPILLVNMLRSTDPCSCLPKAFSDADSTCGTREVKANAQFVTHHAQVNWLCAAVTQSMRLRRYVYEC